MKEINPQLTPDEINIISGALFETLAVLIISSINWWVYLHILRKYALEILKFKRILYFILHSTTLIQVTPSSVFTHKKHYHDNLSRFWKQLGTTFVMRYTFYILQELVMVWILAILTIHISDWKYDSVENISIESLLE